MANDGDDFTFCRVEPPVDGLEAEKVRDDINGIRLDDRYGNAVDNIGNQNGGSMWKLGGSSEKQDTVGSLSFRVIDACSRKEVDQQPSVKQETVGSLSFSVVDASVRKEVDQQPKLAENEGAKSSSKASPEQKTSSRKSTARAKVPFEKGYSQMDWIKLTRTHPDLAGLKGQSNKRLITLKEVKQHQSEGDMWTVLKGRVYNIAPYMKFHPGGVDDLMRAVGKDCTSLFNKYHAWVNAEFLLEKCLVGILDEGK